MEIVNIHEAKSQLSKLLRRVAEGEDIVIARSGVPIARLTRVEAPEKAPRRRIGFMAGEIEVPDDFDRMCEREITAMFEGSEES